MWALSSIFDTLFPLQCVLCQNYGAYLCRDCKKTLEVHPSLCPVCYYPSPHYQTCLHCTHQTPLTWCIIGFWYWWAIKKIIHLLKYKHISTASLFLADQLTWHLRTHPLMSTWTSPLLLCPIPTHRRKVLLKRGYDHIKLLTQEISLHCNIPAQNLLKKSRFTRSQVGLSRQQRYHNLSWSFQITPWISLIWDETILLVDDLFTSGATLVTAANALLARRPTLQIWGLVVSRHIH